MQEEKHSISDPSPEYPSELVRRYRESGVRSSRRSAGASFLHRVKEDSRRPSSRRRKHYRSRSSSDFSPSKPATSEAESGHALTYEERRLREQTRSRRRNGRIMGRRRVTAIKQLALNVTYLLLAAGLAWMILNAALTHDIY